MQGKICVSKQGEVLKVYVDPITSRPLPLSSFADEPAGSFPITATNLTELRANLHEAGISTGGAEFQFLEKPAAPEKTVKPLSPEQQARVAKIMRDNNIAGAAPPLTAIAVETGEPVRGIAVPLPGNDARLLHAEEFLKRLRTAREYASKKNQRELDIKIAAVEELIGEVFKS